MARGGVPLTDRPRDGLGRPLPAGSAGVPGVPDRASVGAAQAWAEAGAHLAADRPFHAHEVLEQRWRCAPDAERAGWRALAQWGAARTHEARGNPAGAASVAARAAAGLDAVLAGLAGPGGATPADGRQGDGTLGEGGPDADALRGVRADCARLAGGG